MKKIMMIAAALMVAVAIRVYNHQPGTADAPLAKAVPAASANHEPINNRARALPGITTGEDRSCRVELTDYVTATGEMLQAYTCAPFGLPPPHPYELYTDATLESLAYADAQAAALLGRRLAAHDHDKAYGMLLRATALDGNTRHLAWLGDAAFGAYRRDGELQVDTVKRRYELAALAAHLGEDPALSLFLLEELLAAGVSYDQVRELDARVEALLETVRNIQIAVYGEVRHGGQSDA